MNYKYENVDELLDSLIGIDYSNYVDSCIINESCKKVIKDLQSLYNYFLFE